MEDSQPHVEGGSGAHHDSQAEASSCGASAQMFDKPNLQLRDPDPYAFANRIRKLILLASVLACLAVLPMMSRIVAYEITRGQERAKADVADEVLGDVVPSMNRFEQASRLVTQKVSPSVVSIFRPQVDRPGRRRPGLDGQGSGFVVDPDGYILTNEHVVSEAARLIVQFNDGSMSDATIVGTDPATDLALLKTDGGNLPAIRWGDSDQLEPGNLVWALGSPFGLERSVTFGIVSATARRSTAMQSIRSGGGSPYQEYLQTDAAVNPGNSGGPLVNLSGDVIGINTAIVGESYRGVSFAIPSNIARAMYEELREKGYIERGYLGIQPIKLPEVVRAQMRLDTGEGVFVAAVVRDGPAAIAGLVPGDVILNWNQHDAQDPTLLSQEIAATEIGSTAEVTVRRLVDGAPKDKTLSVEVRRNPHSAER